MRAFLLALALAAVLCGGAHAQLYPLTGAGGKFKTGGVAPPSYTGPGDLISGATFWGGLRCYNHTLAGNNAIRIRRASDDTETNVTLTASCDLTDVSATFCAATTCFVKTLYDQSGNGNDAVQTTAANQPRLVFNCIGALPCISFDGSPQYLYATTAAAWVNPVSTSVVSERDVAGRGATNTSVVISSGSVGGQEGWVSANDTAYSGNADILATVTDGAFHAFQAVFEDPLEQASLLNADGLVATNTTNTVSGGDIAIGIFVDLTSAPLVGRVAEVGAWSTTFSSAQQSSLCSNQHAYWSTPACAAAPTYVGPGDLMGDARAWYGLRCYRSVNASTNAIRIRRASDNTEQDVALTASCNLTDVSATFCSGTTCFVKTMYDQSGNGNDITQATNSQQPQLVFSCIGTKPCLQFVAADQTILISSTTPSASQPLVLSSVNLRSVNPSQFTSFFGAVSSPEVSDRPIIGYTNTSGIAFCYAGNIGDVSSTASDGVWHSLQAVFNGASSIMASDNSQNTTDCGAGGFIGTSNIGVGGETITPQYMDGKATEAGLWPRAFNATGLTNLCRNQQAYWGSGNFEAAC